MHSDSHWLPCILLKIHGTCLSTPFWSTDKLSSLESRSSRLQHLGPDSPHSPHDPPFRSPALMRPTYKHVSTKTPTYMFRGKFPLKNDNMSVHFRWPYGSSLPRLLPMFPPRLKFSFTWKPLSVCSEVSPHSRTITQAYASRRSFRLIPNWTTALQEAHPRSVNYHPYSSFSVGSD